MERAKHDCVYGTLEFEFDEQVVRCGLNRAAINDNGHFKTFRGGLCPFYSQERSVQKNCKNYDRISYAPRNLKI